MSKAIGVLVVRYSVSVFSPSMECETASQEFKYTDIPLDKAESMVETARQVNGPTVFIEARWCNNKYRNSRTRESIYL